MTGKQALIALSAAIALGVAGASVAQANDNDSGDYHGGFVQPGNMNGVNPVYHPRWFGPQARQTANGAAAYGASVQKHRGNVESR
jgi:hypothetical protein